MNLSRQAFIGAAAGAVLVVTVYEGRVLLASGGHSRAAEAGQTALVSSKGAEPEIVPSGQRPVARAAAPAPPGAALDPPPSDTATRAELLARDREQRAELARLRTRVGGLEEALSHARRSARTARKEAKDDGNPWFEPGPALLEEFARECRVRYDLPPIMGAKPSVISPKRAERLGVTEDELATINGLLAAMHARWRSEVHALYVEATGDTGGADTLSTQAMAREIQDKSLPGAHNRVQQRIAWERAGLAQAPSDWSRASPLERYYRQMSQLGDEMEVALGQKIGPQRARDLREKNDGWGSRSVYSGCPAESDERKTATEDVDED